MTRRTIAILTLALTSITPVTQAQDTSDELANTRKVFEELVKTRQEIADQQALWRTQEESLTGSIKLLKLEIAKLEERITLTEEESTQADKDRISLNAQIEELKEATAVVKTAIRPLELRVLQLSEALPDNKKTALSKLIDRIPDRNTPERSIRSTLTERMQNIVGILNQMEVFNNAITTDKISHSKDGQSFTVDVIYFGFAQAFYVNEDYNTAGYMTVDTENGWTDHEAPELTANIRRLIRVANNEIPAEFVTLPIQ